MSFRKGEGRLERQKRGSRWKGSLGENLTWHLDEVVLLAVSRRLLRIVPQGESGTMMAFQFSKGPHLHIESDNVMDETGRELSVTHSCCLEVRSLLSEGGPE
jgi:hypothetical protein